MGRHVDAADAKAQLCAGLLPESLKANKLDRPWGSRWRKDLRERWDGSLLLLTVDDSRRNASDALSWHLQTLQLQRLQTLLRYQSSLTLAVPLNPDDICVLHITDLLQAIMSK